MYETRHHTLCTCELTYYTPVTVNMPNTLRNRRVVILHHTKLSDYKTLNFNIAVIIQNFRTINSALLKKQALISGDRK